MSSNLNSFPLLALLAFTGCGFTPLYGGGGESVATQLATVQVANIPERPGQMLRDSLQDQLYTGGAPTIERYTLAVSYQIAEQGVGIQADTASTRTRFIAIAHWTLAPVGAPTAPLTSGFATTENAANIIDQQYFALTLETTTINQQLADTISAQITTQLAAYFKTHPTA